MKWIINNDNRPVQEGRYYTQDSYGNKEMTDFYDGNWFSKSGHPIEKWLDEASNDPVFSLEDIKDAFEEGSGSYYTFGQYMKEHYNIDIP